MVVQATEWDEIVDVVVVGSGGAALTAAVRAANEGAKVLVVEKDDSIGGTTGVSGGVMWVPQNHHLEPAGLEDSRADAIAYLESIADGRAMDPALIEVFVDTVPKVLEYLEAHTPLQTQLVTNLPDYYGGIRHRIPGCQPFSRSVEPLPFEARAQLGEHADRIAARSTLLSLGAQTTLVEDLSGSVGMDELARRERSGIRVKGAALIGTLVKALVDLGVEIRTSTPASELVVGEDRSVLGLVVGGEGGTRIGARKGVILACGGFEWNPEMVMAYLGYEVKPLSPGANTGDGHVMAMEAGAKMGNMTSYWGQGAMFDPAITDAAGNTAAQMAIGVGPGSVIVNQQGERFMHGGYTYNDFPKVFGNFDHRHPGLINKPPAWAIFGSKVKERQNILTMRPGEPAPDWLVQATSIRELAEAIGVAPDTLEATLARVDEYAAAGEDPEWGDPGGAVQGTGGAGPLEPIGPGPYYAIQQWPATLGTNGGCRINEHGQVLGHRRDVIEGLYAAGNTSATVLGGAYVGGGAPIASGATFGYLAGGHAANRQARDIERAAVATG
jgi:3-oxosteroid 1-dehydrogenase